MPSSFSHFWWSSYLKLGPEKLSRLRLNRDGPVDWTTAPGRWAGRLKPIMRNVLPAMSKHAFKNVFELWIKIETADKELRRVSPALNNDYGTSWGGVWVRSVLGGCCSEPFFFFLIIFLCCNSATVTVLLLLFIVLVVRHRPSCMSYVCVWI